MSSISTLKLRERRCCFKVTDSRRGIKSGVKLLLIINVSVLVLKPQVEFLGRLLPPAPPVCKHLFANTCLCLPSCLVSCSQPVHLLLVETSSAAHQSKERLTCSSAHLLHQISNFTA